MPLRAGRGFPVRWPILVAIAAVASATATHAQSIVTGADDLSAPLSASTRSAPSRTIPRIADTSRERAYLSIRMDVPDACELALSPTLSNASAINCNGPDPYRLSRQAIDAPAPLTRYSVEF